MSYEQLPLFQEKPVALSAWYAMGAILQECPGCGQYVIYCGNTNMYSVVCNCGWYTLPLDDGHIVWLSPLVTEDQVKARFWAQNIQN